MLAFSFKARGYLFISINTNISQRLRNYTAQTDGWAAKFYYTLEKDCAKIYCCTETIPVFTLQGSHPVS